MESFNLNIIPGKTRPVCHASQFDTGRAIRVNLFEDANIYTLSGSEEVSLSVRKPDGNVVTVEIENAGDSFVEIVTTEQMTACAGSNLCELKIEDDGKVIGTMNFILETEQDPLEGGIESESSIYNLETQVNDMVTDAVADQYDSNAVIFDQEPTAGHGNGYAVTSEGIKAAIDAVSSAVDAVSSAVDDLSGEVDTLDITVQAKQNANDPALATTSKNVVGAINEVKSSISTISSWEDITSEVSATSNIENLIYKINRATGLKYIYFEIKAGVADDSLLINSLPYVINHQTQGLNSSAVNYASVQIGAFYAYYHSSGNVYYRCKSPTTSNVKIYVSGILV